MYQKALQICPLSNQKVFKDNWAKTTIQSVNDPYAIQQDCLRPAHGCFWKSTNAVFIKDPVVLPDELGHSVWDYCFGRPGEVTANGKTTYDPDFQQWVDYWNKTNPL